MSKHDRLVWIDLEMTGLDPDHHVVVEVAALVTDADLNILGQGVDIVVHATEEQLAGMNELVADMHGSSGLTEAIIPRRWPEIPLPRTVPSFASTCLGWTAPCTTA